ncbi:hypothetical protein M438DRAFT_340413 [Aureobasidium pullulans EXF-150]|uniref:Uncharacterized protein n=1 Tax=Aureobasidium pullulans EXF-150 TaxID=1043002 RepID=A0A074X9M0_AURPU|nr:uncharacterized protein M438DRAFT_340413 [Aureobasidium pullulans EXF-150]KEQ78752.1 hypothetical protein M438DRAFT_340413 [Aureobasidium pullulans EXF-150]
MSHYDPLGTVNEVFRLLAPDARVVWERDDKGEINHVKYNTIEAASKARDAVMEETNKNDATALNKIEEDHLAEELIEEKPSRDALADYYAAVSDAIRNNTPMPEPYSVSDDSDSASETGDVQENKEKQSVHDTPGSTSKEKKKVMICEEDHRMPATTHQEYVEAREKGGREKAGKEKVGKEKADKEKADKEKSTLPSTAADKKGKKRKSNGNEDAATDAKKPKQRQSNGEEHVANGHTADNSGINSGPSSEERSSKKRVAEEMEDGDVEENKSVRSIKKMKKKGKSAQK